MFTRLAHMIVRYPTWVFGFSIGILLLAAASMAMIAPDLSSEYTLGDGVESSVVNQRVVDEFGATENSVLIVFTGDGATTGDAFLEQVDTSAASLMESESIQTVISPGNSGNPALISADGSSALVIGQIPNGTTPSSADLAEIEDLVHNSAAANGLDVQFGGGPFIDEDINSRIESGLIRAELFSIPVALVVLLLVFGTLVAAGMPLVAGAASIVLAMAILAIWSNLGVQSVFAINVVTMLGLGLGIDYSLFLVKRYRDELRTKPQEDALTTAIQTVGKAIFFSGITVILGLGGTMFFDMPQLRSLGQAGMIVTSSTMFFGLTLLPATLMLLGPRINKGRVGRKQSQTTSGESPFWANVAHAVMRRPVVVLLGTIGVLAILAFPLTDIRLVPGGFDMLPTNSEPRQVMEQIITDFPEAAADPIHVIVESTDEATVNAFLADVQQIDGVTAAFVTQQTDATLIEVASAYDPDDSAHIVENIRDRSTSDTKIQVGGSAAFNLDSTNIVNDGLLPAALFVLISSYIVLLLTFGSVWLPLKAMFMSALSISASMGVVVWVFQWGNLEGLLNFTASGGIVSMVPILVACILFGLSMDYEVLLLSRIQEDYEATGDNRHAIATGLANTGQVVTGAALVMVAVFGGFVLADISLIQSLGFGLAFAVLLDATIVRGVLVPTTMALMGRWNWWAPEKVRAVVNKLGVSHTEPRVHAPIIPQPNPEVGSD